MAKGDLLRLVKQASAELKKDTEWYRTYFDIRPHQFTMTTGSVLVAIQQEIDNDDLFVEHRIGLEALAKDYVDEVGKKLLNKRAAVVKFQSIPGGFTVLLTAKDQGSIGPRSFKPTANGPQLYYPVQGTSVFRLINDAKSGAQKTLVNGINALLKGRTREFNSSNFIDTGHDIGVAEKQRDIVLSRLARQIAKAPTVANLAATEARLEILSKFEGPAKKFIISVQEESAQSNRSKATQEKEFLRDTRILLQKFIDEKKDWALQGGSDSKLSEIEKTIWNAAIKAGAKNQKKPIKKEPASATDKIKGKVQVTRSQNVEKLKLQHQAESLSRLTGLKRLLNLRITPYVIARMIPPALVNRTGNFANSVKIAEISRTSGGFLSIGYTYQRSPYDVFDPVLGRAPWNKPTRDPKKLIDRAIRDAAKDLITERFYTRRV